MNCLVSVQSFDCSAHLHVAASPIVCDWVRESDSKRQTASTRVAARYVRKVLYCKRRMAVRGTVTVLVAVERMAVL
jgi:hypothetical protein